MHHIEVSKEYQMENFGYKSLVLIISKRKRTNLYFCCTIQKGAVKSFSTNFNELRSSINVLTEMTK